MNSKKATLIGLAAVVLWSSIVGLIRSVSEYFGATSGAAMIYSAASLILLCTVGVPKPGSFPKKYLLWGSLLFVAYELCLSLSIGYANSGRQAIEVGMVNYLWPTFTLICAMAFGKQRATLLVVPGFALSIVGIAWVVGGDQGLDVAGMLANVRDNPVSYGLALAGAVVWAAYCTVTTNIAKGKNGVTLFFILVSAALWVKFFMEDHSPISFSMAGGVYLLLAAAAMGFGYAAWNVGILHGNVTVLAGASYFIPIFSSLLSALLLQAPLPKSFWIGASLVCGGSILCWRATKAENAPARQGNVVSDPG